jgi:hypothetical protein
VATDISDEMALLKTQHGLIISSLRSINDMRHAYQAMNTIGSAPYLHIDYNYQARAAFKPLTILEITPQHIVVQWRAIANTLEDKLPNLADNIQDAIDRSTRAEFRIYA